MLQNILRLLFREVYANNRSGTPVPSNPGPGGGGITGYRPGSAF